MDEKMRLLENVHKDLAGGHFGVHKTYANVMKMAYALHVCSLI